MSDALETTDEKTECCGNCIYFRRLPVDPKNLGQPIRGGICKRRPPTAIILMAQNPVTGRVIPQLQSQFPPVPDTELCGDYDDGIYDDEEATQ